MAEPIDVSRPSLKLLMKLGSAIVHADEFLSGGGHPYDEILFRQLVADPEVEAWIKEMGALLPLKRKKS